MNERCTHEHQELRAGFVRIEWDEGVFSDEYIHAWQCLNCGMVTRREVTADDMKFDPCRPQLDVEAYHEAIHKLVLRAHRLEVRDEATLRFFAEAMRT